MLSHTDRSGAPGYVCKPCYEDFEEVVNALRVLVGFWSQALGRGALEGAFDSVFRRVVRKISLYGAFKVGEMATE